MVDKSTVASSSGADSASGDTVVTSDLRNACPVLADTISMPERELPWPSSTAALSAGAHSALGDTGFTSDYWSQLTRLSSQHRAMASRPDVHVGDVLRTKELPTRIRCKVYDAAPPYGQYLETLAPGTLIGPVLSTCSSPVFETVEIAAGWVNIWTSRRRGVQFAFVETPPRAG